MFRVFQIAHGFVNLKPSWDALPQVSFRDQACGWRHRKIVQGNAYGSQEMHRIVNQK